MFELIEQIKALQLPNDFGPLYAETKFGRFPVEPLNTISNLPFLVMLVYWFRKLKLESKLDGFYYLILTVLLIGFIGGTLFHATRSHRIWLLMDFIPIITLCLLASGFIWTKVTQSISKGLLIMLISYLSVIAVRLYADLPKFLAIGVGYSGLALCILLPAFILSAKTKWLGIMELLLAISLFAVAISFRQFDKFSVEYISFGTHFLWHLFGAFATHQIFNFIYMSRSGTAR